MKKSIKRIFKHLYFENRFDNYYSYITAPFSDNIEVEYGNILEIKRVPRTI